MAHLRADWQQKVAPVDTWSHRTCKVQQEGGTRFGGKTIPKPKARTTTKRWPRVTTAQSPPPCTYSRVGGGGGNDSDE